MSIDGPELEIGTQLQTAWEVADPNVEDEQVYRTLEKVKANFNLWTHHYASEPSHWPAESIEIWSVGQTLHPKSLSEYGLSEDLDPDQKQRLESAISGYLFQEAKVGLEKWTGDKWEEHELGSANKATVSLARTASNYFPVLEKKFEKSG